MIAAVDGVDTSDAQRWAGDTLVSNISYQEWAGWKKKVAKSGKSGTIGTTKNIFSKAKTKKDADAYLKDALGISSVKTTGVPVDAMNAINEALTKSFEEYPQLKGVIQQVAVFKEKDSEIASFDVKFEKGKISTRLSLGANNLGDVEQIAATIKYNVDTGFWTPKDGIQGIVQHEMGHALEFVQTFKEKGVDPFSTDVNGLVNRFTAVKAYEKCEVAEKVVNQAINNLNMNPDDWKTLSDYASENYSEAFAEALSDSSDNLLSNEIKRIAKGGFE